MGAGRAAFSVQAAARPAPIPRRSAIPVLRDGLAANRRAARRGVRPCSAGA